MCGEHYILVSVPIVSCEVFLKGSEKMSQQKQLPEYIWVLNESVTETIQWDRLEVSCKGYSSVSLFLFLEVVLAPG